MATSYVVPLLKKNTQNTYYKTLILTLASQRKSLCNLKRKKGTEK